jgi:hypothetical protein
MIIREPCGKIYYKNSKLRGKRKKKKKKHTPNA